MKKREQITFKLEPDWFNKLQERVTADTSPSLIARDLLIQALQNGAPPPSPVSQEMARAVWLIISALSPDLSSDQVAELVKRCLLDGKNAPEFKA